MILSDPIDLDKINIYTLARRWVNKALSKLIMSMKNAFDVRPYSITCLDSRYESESDTFGDFVARKKISNALLKRIIEIVDLFVELINCAYFFNESELL